MSTTHPSPLPVVSLFPLTADNVKLTHVPLPLDHLPLPKPHKLHGLLYCSHENCPSSHNLSHHHAHGVTSNEVVVDRVAMAINIFHRAYFGSRGVLPLCFVRPSRKNSYEVSGAAA